MGFKGSSSAGNVWTSFTPTIGTTADGVTFTNQVTIGNGTKAAFYRKTGVDTLDVRYYLSWGSSSSVSAGYFWFQLPGSATVTSGSLPGGLDAQQLSLGLSMFHDFGTNVYTGCAGLWANASNKLQGALYKTGSTYIVIDTISTTVPAATAAGDEIFISVYSLPVTGI